MNSRSINVWMILFAAAAAAAAVVVCTDTCHRIFRHNFHFTPRSVRYCPIYFIVTLLFFAHIFATNSNGMDMYQNNGKGMVCVLQRIASRAGSLSDDSIYYYYIYIESITMGGLKMSYCGIKPKQFEAFDKYHIQSEPFFVLFNWCGEELFCVKFKHFFVKFFFFFHLSLTTVTYSKLSRLHPNLFEIIQIFHEMKEIKFSSFWEVLKRIKFKYVYINVEEI